MSRHPYRQRVGRDVGRLKQSAGKCKRQGSRLPSSSESDLATRRTDEGGDEEEEGGDEEEEGGDEEEEVAMSLVNLSSFAKSFQLFVNNRMLMNPSDCFI